MRDSQPRLLAAPVSREHWQTAGRARASVQRGIEVVELLRRAPRC
jgi:hypothetical protein